MSVEQPPIPNVEHEGLNYSPLVGLQGRLVTEQFDPALDVGQMTAATVKALPERDTSIYKRASLAERAGNEQTVNAWATSTAEKIKPFFASEAGRNYQRILQKAGISLTQCTGDELTVVYNKYFGLTGKESNVAGFVQDILTPYIRQDRIDYETLKKDLKVFRWFAQIFGANSSEIIAQLADAEAQLILNKAEFVNKVNEQQNGKSRVDRLNEEEKRLLTFLNQFSERKDAVTTGRTDPTDPPITEEDDTTEDDDETGEQLPLPDTEQEYRLEELFGQVVGPVNKNTDYFVGNPPATLTLTAEDLKKYQSNKAFFSTYDPITGIFNPNPEVVPYTFDLGEDVRFQNAEALTDGDSGLLAVSAVASGKGRDAESAKKQAIVFKHLVNAILSIHRVDKDLLSEWINTQRTIAGGDRSSLSFFTMFDRDRNTGELKPESQRLFHYDTAGRATIFSDLRFFDEMWQARMTELETALRMNKLKKHHLRWLEFLSHSTDVKGLLDLMKEKAETKKKSEKKEPIRVTPKENLAAANLFCARVREQIKEGVASKYEVETRYTDVKSGLSLSIENSRTPEALSNAWFEDGVLINYANRIGLPLVLWNSSSSTSGNHISLLLKGPTLYADDQYRVLVYNPQKDSAHLEIVDIQQSFSDFYRAKKQELEPYLNRDKNRYEWGESRGDDFDFEGSYVEADKLDEFLYKQWLKPVQGRSVSYSTAGLRTLVDGQYDLSIEDDSELPVELKMGKTQAFQADGHNCGPLSLYAGMVRYLAMPGNEAHKKQIAQTLRADFNLWLLTRDELLGVGTSESTDSLIERMAVVNNSKRFIEVLRDPENMSRNKLARNKRVTVGGLQVDDDGWFKVNTGLEGVQDKLAKRSAFINHLAAVRYSMPVAIRGADMTAHARLVIKGPYRSSSGWLIDEWDPKEGVARAVKVSGDFTPTNDKSILLTNFTKAGIQTNNVFLDQYIAGGGDVGIDIATDTELNLLLSGRASDVFLRPLQTEKDAVNCLPLTLYTAAVLNALRAGDSEFKQKGLGQFEKDFGITLRTRESLLGGKSDEVLDLTNLDDYLDEAIDQSHITITKEDLRRAENVEMFLSYGQNSAAFKEWIANLRAKLTQDGSNKTYTLPAESGFRETVVRAGEHGWFDISSMVDLSIRYGAPLAFYHDSSAAHALLVLKVLDKKIEGGKIKAKVLVYEPWTGEQNRDLSGKHKIGYRDVDRETLKEISIEGDVENDFSDDNWDDYNQWVPLGIFASNSALALLGKDQYDLSLNADPLLIANNEFLRAKTGAYQPETDAQNCTLYSYLTGMMRAAFKYNSTDPSIPPEYKFFYDQGLAQFSKDWQIANLDDRGNLLEMPFSFKTR